MDKVCDLCWTLLGAVPDHLSKYMRSWSVHCYHFSTSWSSTDLYNHYVAYLNCVGTATILIHDLDHARLYVMLARTRITTLPLSMCWLRAIVTRKWLFLSGFVFGFWLLLVDLLVGLMMEYMWLLCDHFCTVLCSSGSSVLCVWIAYGYHGFWSETVLIGCRRTGWYIPFLLWALWVWVLQIEIWSIAVVDRSLWLQDTLLLLLRELLLAANVISRRWVQMQAWLMSRMSTDWSRDRLQNLHLSMPRGLVSRCFW